MVWPEFRKYTHHLNIQSNFSIHTEFSGQSIQLKQTTEVCFYRQTSSCNCSKVSSLKDYLIKKMSIVVGILTYTQRVWLVCFFFTTVTSQSCRESISSSTCILPEPQPNLEAGHLDTLWLEVRCMLGCIEKVRIMRQKFIHAGMLFYKRLLCFNEYVCSVAIK